MKNPWLLIDPPISQGSYYLGGGPGVPTSPTPHTPTTLRSQPAHVSKGARTGGRQVAIDGRSFGLVPKGFKNDGKQGTKPQLVRIYIYI